MRLKGKTAIITGAASGIGRAIAVLFAREGAQITVADVNDDAGRETVRLVSATGATALYCHADVSNSEEVQRMIRTTADFHGAVHVLVNNAAHMKDYGTAVDSSEEQWDRSIAVTLKGAFLCSKYAVPEMIQARGGSIINVASVGGVVGFAGLAAYCSAKGGIIQLTKSLAIDYGLNNIRVNAISPGAIDTDTCPKDTNEKLYRYQIEMGVLGRTGQPLEIAYPALFLASDESSFLTGANLVVDGGWTLR